MEPPTPVWVNDTGQDILIAEGPDAHVFTVPKAAAWEDRVTAAELLLQMPSGSLMPILHVELEPVEAPTEEEARAGEPEGEPPVEDDVDADDVFAEARQARRKK